MNVEDVTIHFLSAIILRLLVLVGCWQPCNFQSMLLCISCVYCSGSCISFLFPEDNCLQILLYSPLLYYHPFSVLYTVPQIPPLQLPLVESVLPPMPTMQRSKAKQHDTKNKKDNKEMYSGKVFVGGLPPDIEDRE